MKTIGSILILLLSTSLIAQNRQRPVSVELGKFFNEDGKRLLYGGQKENQHFNVSNLSLEEDQFHYGLGREAFPALLKPKFTSIQKADKHWDDSDRFLVAKSGDEVKAYSIQDLTRHEIVNDKLNGKPIMAAYCVLADLGAIYKRDYGDKVFTFGLSGYTYYDPDIWDGKDGFVFWDRETESLWWPLIGKAVSGKMKGAKLHIYDKTNWEDTTWKQIKLKYPSAKILISGQDFERPSSWPQYQDVSDVKDL
ncbi:DUF3179 domain-containing (seleno)protein [Mesohalobacter halotolerans]|uniref:DUF3179 domain-containing protein n=1 Tax=Mesohalobacter halotolerans TaxID=1883405 RepID=A0A4V6ALB6_9FLAO|nr:DUF3179 domain-containing (seleno)protein [Mesohalobacter halotolerans]TKS55975.1 DUF3179 domain-containing protein [Mesohalobacter halotolerans]